MDGETCLTMEFLEYSTTIGIGFSSKAVSLSRAPGWEPESWGYHGDDGHCFASQNAGKHYGPTFTTGDVIGCGVNFRTGTAFFTKNGENLSMYEAEGSHEVLEPSLPLLGGVSFLPVLTLFVVRRDGFPGSQGKALSICWHEKAWRTCPCQLRPNTVRLRH